MTLMTEFIPLYKDTTLSIDVRVRDLVSRMNIEEKVSQMLFNAPAIERLDIPEYNWWNEGLHGLGRAGVATVFPQAIGLAAMWNADLMFEVACAISDEIRAKHHEAVRRGIRQIYSGLTIWSPNINIFRDPRWGRGQETYGEDPYLTAALAVSFVKALQGDDPHYLKLVATPKHFAVHSGPEGNRHSFDAQASEYDMRETYLPAFEVCIKEAQAASVMGAYNRLNGTPCCASPTLLEQILRQEWGFEGYVVSDCEAITDIYAHHKVVETAEEAAALAVKHGCDLNCGSTYPALVKALAEGLIDEALIDQAVMRLFTARFRLGMFDPPEKLPYQLPVSVIDSPKHRELALKAAHDSIVLLKNKNDFLPLDKTLDSIAIIGPNADDLPVLLGNYQGTPRKAVTVLDGIRQKLSSSTKLYYAPGCELAHAVPRLTPIGLAYLRPFDTAQEGWGLGGSYYDNPDFEGTPQSYRVDPVIDFIWKDSSPLSGEWGEHFSVCWHGFIVPPVSGRYTLGVNGLSDYHFYLNGYLKLSFSGIHHPFLKTIQVDLEAGRFYEVRLEYVNQGLDPQIQLLWEIPDLNYEATALEVAAKADVIVAVMGLSPSIEGEEMPIKIDGFANGDRTEIKLPDIQQALLKKLYQTGKPVVLVLMNGSALAVNWAAEHIPAIVEAWYPGQAGGRAIADVLFGDYNPSGRLPITMYKSIEDLPPFEDYQMQGRTYRYFEGEPLFPFGHGLSYTKFVFEPLNLECYEVEVGANVTVSLDVTNVGSRRGDEVVQLYLRHLEGEGGKEMSRSLPLKELKGFKRVTLEPGERKRVTFTLSPRQLGYYDEMMEFAIHPGRIEVMLGRSSADLPLTGTVQLIGERATIDGNSSYFSQVQVE